MVLRRAVRAARDQPSDAARCDTRPKSSTSSSKRSWLSDFDCTDVAAPGLRHAGLVTGALWSDADNDGRPDLLIALEWGGVRFWRNTGGKLVDRSIDAGLEGETGWWNGITGTDIDSDGDIDYVVTNLGLNTKYHAEPDRPARLYYGDFDGTGRARLVEAEYENDRLFPVRGRSCSSAAMPFIGTKFSTFESFARADLAGIYTPEAVAGAEAFEAVRFHSAVLINSGKARFELRPLPALAQAAPGFGVVAADLDGDSHPDVCIAQNNFSPQPETGRMDGGLCMLLRGSRGGTLSPVFPAESGLVVPGDVKGLSLCDLDGNGWPDLVMTQNDGPLLAFLNTGAESDGRYRVVAVRLRGPAGNPNAVGARISVLGRNGARQTAEVYCGSGYLSQSTSWQFFGVEGGDDRPLRFIVRWPDGRQSSHAIDRSKVRVTLAQPSD